MKIKINLTVVFLVILNYSISQTYVVSTSIDTYQQLSGTSMVDESNPDSINISPIYKAVPIGFNFKLRNVIFDSISLSENGFAVFRKADTNRLSISLFEGDLFNFQGTPSLSPINYITTGSTGNRIFKCEYVNSGFTNDPENDDFINVQLWLYEACSDFEIRVGNNSINSNVFWGANNTPFIGIASYEDNYVSSLIGGPTSPTLQIAPPIGYVDSIPYEGLVYHFSNCFLEVDHIKNENRISVFPNPSKDILHINLNDIYSKISIEIIDLEGRIVSNKTFYSKQNIELNNSDLSTGVYIICITTNGWKKTSKINIGQ